MVVPVIAGAVRVGTGATKQVPKVLSKIGSTAKTRYKELSSKYSNVEPIETIKDFNENYGKKKTKTQDNFLEGNTKEGNNTTNFEGFEIDKEVEKEKAKTVPTLKNPIKAGKILPDKLFSIGKLGNVGLLLFIILFIVFSIQTIKGQNQTRIQLLGKVLLNRTSLANEEPTIMDQVGDVVGAVGDAVETGVDSVVDAGSYVWNGTKDIAGSVQDFGSDVLSGIGGLFK